MSVRTPSCFVRSLAAWTLASLLLVACRPVPPPSKPDAVATARPASAPVTRAEPQRGGIMLTATREDPPANWDPMYQTSISLLHVGISIFGDGNLVRSCPDDIYKI